MYNSRLSVDRIRALIHRGGRIHFVGILGAGMMPLALMLMDRDCVVTGSDIGAESGKKTNNIPIYTHAPTLARAAELVVYSLAIDERDMDITAATEAGVPLVSRAQLLGALMLEYPLRIGVGGSHGKSTVTALIDHILSRAGLSPTTVSGALLSDGVCYRKGTGDIFIYESCEYKDSHLCFFPTHQIITSVEHDHTDYFPTLVSVRDSFLECAKRTKRTVIISDTAELGDTSRIPVPVLTYGKMNCDDFSYEILDKRWGVCRFSVKTGEKESFLLETPLIGDFNIENIVAAVVLARELKIDKEVIKSAVRDFHGISRRLDRLGEVAARPLIYDYAHHPTEIERAIRAVKERFGVCTVIFRPHTYTRTESLWDGFVRSLSLADFSVLVDIYPARETPIPGITSQRLALAIGERSRYLPMDAVVDYVISQTDGAIILMGAGDVEKIKNSFLESDKFKEI